MIACAPCACATEHGSYALGPLTAGRAGHCDACHTTWTGNRACHCRACCRSFSSVSAFDEHRRRFRCVDPATVGLVERDGVWSWPQDARFAEAASVGAAGAAGVGSGHVVGLPLASPPVVEPSDGGLAA